MSLGWIDYSKDERNKVIGVLDLLSESGTLDELGIAPVRDGFANLFFPGTTTIQTRAKYFLIIPYILKELELSGETSPRRMQAALYEKERKCGEVLMKKHPSEDGIVGSSSLARGKWVKRQPSEIYWAGLKRYGIFLDQILSINDYINAVCTLKRQKTNTVKLGNRKDNPDEVDSDDVNAGGFFHHAFWNIPTYKRTWEQDLDINLSEDEAAFLKNQMEKTCPDSILQFILKNELVNITAFESFQDMKAITGTMPPKMRTDYGLAYAFSEFVLVLQTVFNIIVSNGNNQRAEELWKEMYPTLPQIAGIDFDAIVKRLGLHQHLSFRAFISKAQEAMRARDMEKLKSIIVQREVSLKGPNRAKTKHPGEFDDDAWFSGMGLDYRFKVTKGIVKDIFEGMGIC